MGYTFLFATQAGNNFYHKGKYKWFFFLPVDEDDRFKLPNPNCIMRITEHATSFVIEPGLWKLFRKIWAQRFMPNHIKQNKSQTVCILSGIYCIWRDTWRRPVQRFHTPELKLKWSLLLKSFDQHILYHLTPLSTLALIEVPTKRCTKCVDKGVLGTRL